MLSATRLNTGNKDLTPPNYSLFIPYFVLLKVIEMLIINVLIVVYIKSVALTIDSLNNLNQLALKEYKMTEQTQSSHKSAPTVPATPSGPTVPSKYDKDNVPEGWTYVNYKNQPGGGFTCGNCSVTEDGSDVNGHNC